MKSIDLRLLFSSLQSLLEAKLHVSREVIRHPGAQGLTTEVDWREMLQVLPLRYQVSKAFVVDCDGHVSDEIDVVIHDRQYSLLLFRHGEATYIPAESVYAVFEVKPELSKETVEYASEKIGSVRRLRRTSVAITHAGGMAEAKEPFRITGGILCLDSRWNPALGNPLKDTLTRLPHQGRLDLGCVLRHGAFDATYPHEGAVTMEISNADTALTFILLHVLDRLQKVGTVPAIDLTQYAKHLQ